MPRGIYKRTKEEKKRLKNLRKGMKTHHTKETKRKIGEKMKGENNPSKRLEVRVKIKEARQRQIMPKHSDERRRKKSEDQRGPKSCLWKGGKTKKNMLIRKRIEFRLWREAVFARDGFTCKKYGTIGGKLEAHHIKNFAQYSELRFDINNGITLSREAHREFHKIYGKKNNIEKQLKEFLYETKIITTKREKI